MRLILLLALIAIAPASAAPASPNLLGNGGFEVRDAVGATADGWEGVPAPGGSMGVDAGAQHSGEVSFRVVVPEKAPVSWYSAYRRVGPLKRGATYTLSAWVRAQDVRDGAGAYVSLNCFDGAGKRLAYFDSPGKATGTGDWRRLTTTGPIADGTSEMRAVVCLHGHGTAWFDDVQVEEGSAATPYRPAAADTERLERHAAEARAAAGWLAALPPRRPGQARVAVLDEQFPQGAGRPSNPAALADALADAGYSVARIDAERLANTAFLDPEQFDLLVLPGGSAFPAQAHASLVQYLRRGGAFLSTGGYAFDRPLVRFQGRWHSPDQLPVGDAPSTPLPFFGTPPAGGAPSPTLPLSHSPTPPSAAGWETHSSKPQGPEIRWSPGPQGAPAVEIHTGDLQAWDTAQSPLVEGKLPAGWSITRFWAKGDARTPSLAVEWHESDGSRWKKALPLSTEWREYTLFPADLTYWQDNPSVGRGGPGDRFRPENARRMLFGVATDIAARGLPHTVWVAGVRVQADAAGALRIPPPRINTRWAKIRDAMWPEPEQIGVFDPGFPLRDVARTRPAPGQAILARFALDAPLTGTSATAMLGLNGHGFGPNRARWIPLLECLDRFGRPRGHAGAVVHHFSGTFAGSSWAVFGVDNVDLFASGRAGEWGSGRVGEWENGRMGERGRRTSQRVSHSPTLPLSLSSGARDVLLPTVAHLLRRLYLHETETAYACYRSGESVLLRTRASNFGRAPRSVEVRFLVTPEGAKAPAATLTRQVALQAGETATVEVSWKPEAFTSDYYTLAAEIQAGGECVDREENAFVVWSPAVLARGPRLGKAGTSFTLDGRPQFLAGCQTYWGQNGSVTARSPAAFARDFRQMRDYGLRWTRCFIPFKSEEDRRISDAIVQLAQKHGIVLYHTPNLHNTADPAELAEQQVTARAIAERYRGVPGLAVDICNEPAFNAEDTALQKAFGRPGKPGGKWQDADVAAFWRCMVEAQRRWASTNRDAVRAGDPDRLVSVGWSQGWGGGPTMKAPITASLDLDFTDRHYYGPPAGLPAELRDVDLRGLGKPLILGECGAKDHPTFKASDPWGMGDDDASYDRRFLSLGHHALGLGAAAISSWHWRDPMEGIFPCGIVHQTGTPRPTALLYRAMALAFGRLKPISAAPAVALVLPDAGRMGGEREAAIRAFHRAADLLVSCRVEFALIPDGALDRLPAGTKALVYPVPLDPSDGTVERLEALVRGGVSLYLSGDLSYDGRRQPGRRDRLSRLCGVEWLADRFTGSPLQRPAAAGDLTPAAGSGLRSVDAHPLIRVKAAGAEVLASCAGDPVVTRCRLGKGQVWFGADPVELAGEVQPGHRALYRAFLAAAGTPGIAVTPDHPDLHVFRVPGRDADALVFRNGGPAAEVKVGEFSLGLAAGGTGFLLVGRDGGVRAVEAQGVVKRAGKEVARIVGHAFVVAMDDRDLGSSRSLLVLPLQAGEVQVATSLPAGARAEVGEMRDGQWKTLAAAAARLAAGRLVLPVAPANRREMVRVLAGQ